MLHQFKFILYTKESFNELVYSWNCLRGEHGEKKVHLFRILKLLIKKNKKTVWRLKKALKLSFVFFKYIET